MKTIRLSNGMVTQVDDEDFEELNSHKWYLNNYGYALRHSYSNGNQIAIFMHRLLLNAPKGLQADHIDCDKLNNQKSNLRIVTNQQNGFNRGSNKNTTSQFKGVYCSNDHRWIAQTKYYGVKVYLGSFKTEEEAALAYNAFAAEHHGVYTKLNEIS